MLAAARGPSSADERKGAVSDTGGRPARKYHTRFTVT